MPDSDNLTQLLAEVIDIHQARDKAKRLQSHCNYCGARLNRGNRTRDHVKARSKGGRVTVPCCRACNELKADMDLEEFRAVMGFDAGVEWYLFYYERGA